jgi:hypothetical protein
MFAADQHVFVHHKNKLQNINKMKIIIVRSCIMYFLRLLYIVTADSNSFFASLQHPHEGPGEVVFHDGSDEPLPHGFELCKCHGQA